MEREREAIANTKQMRRELDDSIDGMMNVADGTYRGDVDNPVNDFTRVIFDISRNDIEIDEQADILREAIKYLTKKGNSYDSLGELVDEAFRQAIDTVDNLPCALLALLRYRLRGQQLGALVS
ncbi:hypothetical protein [Bradyrhizobium sp. P5_C11_2]